MPRRPPLNPEGYIHIGTRGVYGLPMFRDTSQRELFLELYDRASTKYGWGTLTWALKRNHHHFVVKLTAGGLSEGLRELHGKYSRRIHAMYGWTGQGHLVRHGFFAREAADAEAVRDMCRYVDLNGYLPWRKPERARWEWCGHAAIMGWQKPRPFHDPSLLLSLLGEDVETARAAYRAHVDEEIARRAAEAPPTRDDRRQTKVSTLQSLRAVIETAS